MQIKCTYDFLHDIPGVPTALRELEFPFFCLCCGMFPSIIFFDANRKAHFRLDGKIYSELDALPADHSVDMDFEWRNACFDAFASAYGVKLHDIKPTQFGKNVARQLNRRL